MREWGKALPWVLVFAVLLGLWYKADLILDRIESAPMYVTTFGFTGKDGIPKSHTIQTPKVRGWEYHLSEVDDAAASLIRRNR